jgi:hypothetical protein
MYYNQTWMLECLLRCDVMLSAAVICSVEQQQLPTHTSATAPITRYAWYISHLHIPINKRVLHFM